MKTLALILSLLSISQSHATSSSEPTPATTNYDIRETFGFAPEHMKGIPLEALPGAWEELKKVEFDHSTALSNKTKSLIGLAVASQIPNKYCIYINKKGVKMNVGSDTEINEAIYMAAETRHWSTYLNGAQISEGTFKNDVDMAMAHFKSVKPSPGIALVDLKSTMQDIQKTFGFTPVFLSSYPQVGLIGAWRGMRDFQLNPDTTLPGKTKELIGLAVSAQIPCKYCVYFHTEAAKLNGATDQEIGETLLLASLTRKWSTIFEGQQMDENKFKKEIDKAMHFMSKKMSTKVALQTTNNKRR